MLYSLAIVLALAMVLCMIPAAFANEITVSKNSYDLAVWAFEDGYANNRMHLASDEGVNTISAEYNYEKMDSDITGQFTEDKKMAILEIKGWDEQFANATDVKVYVDGKKLEVNEWSEYWQLQEKQNEVQIGWNANWKSVSYPIELTKSGWTDTFVVELTGKVNNGNDTITETAKISVRMENTASYKNAKTAYISTITSELPKQMDAYIVGDKIYLDFVGDYNSWDGWFSENITIGFTDNNHDQFDVVTWAYDVRDVDDGKAYMRPVEYNTVNDRKGAKLSDSEMTYEFKDGIAGKTLTFELETGSAIYETKEYEVVVRSNIKEADPKGIYFAESTKTIAIGEQYTPVVMGVATSKKVDPDALKIGTGSDAQVLDVDGDTIIGTKEGVAYITAEYTPAGGSTPYISSSMKITVTAKGATDDDDDDKDGKTYMVTASSLRVRSGAGTNFSQIGSLKNGATVKVESIANGWAKLENGGYVSAQYLAEVVDNGEAQTMYVTARTLNVRKGPGTSYAKVGTLSRGTAVQVVGFSGNWAKLSNGYYVSTSYLAK